MEDLAKRVRPPHPCINSTSTASAPGRSRAESAIARTSSGPMRSATSAHSHLDVPEPSGRGAVADAGRLARLALPAVRRPPQHPFLRPAHRDAGTPESGGDPSVVGVPVEVGELAVLDPAGYLASELEVHALVIDRPRRVRGHEDAVLRVAQDLADRPFAGLEVDVGHADEREVLPPVGPHGARRRSAHDWGRLPAREELLEDPSLDQGDSLGWHAFVVEGEAPQPARERGVTGDGDEVAGVAQLAPVLGSDEGGPGVGLLHLEHPVELEGVTHGLVDLHDHLVAVEDERRHLARAVLRREELDGFPPRPLGLIDQPKGSDVLVARGPEVSPERVGEGPPLDLAVPDGGGLDAASRVDDGLVDGGTFARGEDRVPAEEVQRGLPEGDTIDPLQATAGLHILVADGEGFGFVGAESGVGVVGARPSSGLYSLLDDLEHSTTSRLGADAAPKPIARSRRRATAPPGKAAICTFEFLDRGRRMRRLARRLLRARRLIRLPR